ncbi:hypothetical protein OMP43_20920 [Sphingomonas sp. CBMAI 2297]|uniref:hypothetical protein n=1 Tax=Sphingomonas sp. CBMAI 2297 TaxID=2991720 RepID=UPI0024539BA4|nr:hypothetical protein [Sphingomonas sp. CBMAI 2297]MDH4746494.1 hypothetical protein [Sphingomonas sp. CBMAI 2297]
MTQARASTLWIMLLTLASMATSFALACTAPVAALAALAAVHMRRRDGIALALAAWGANQAVGFLFLHYPHDPKTLLWGLGLGTAAAGSAIGAYAALARLRLGSTPVRLAIAYVAAFVAGKLVTLCWATVLGGVAITLHPGYSLDQFLRNGAILIGLYAFYHLLRALGMPAPRQQLAAA